MTDTTQPPSTFADVGIKLVDIVGKVANVALKVDKGIEGVDAIVGPFADFIPYYAQAIAVVKIADPILTKIVQYEPAVEGGLEVAKPILDAAQANGPALISYVKSVMGIAAAHDPTGAITTVSVAEAKAFGDIMFAGTKIQSVWEASFFSPQDPRFDRLNATA